jgi:carbonic anhydrase/acetyltransferase-like protein (isoleucine patch superfamily)
MTRHYRRRNANGLCNRARQPMPLYSIDGFAPELPPGGECYIAPNAVLIGRVRIKRHASIWFGAVLRGDNDWITVGEGSNVQDQAMVHADAGEPVSIGNNVTIGHRAIIHSASVGDGSLIGMGAILLNRARIGAACVIGAGALVAEGKSIEDGMLALGTPARALRRLEEAERDRLIAAAAAYVDNGRRYCSGLVDV